MDALTANKMLQQMAEQQPILSKSLQISKKVEQAINIWAELLTRKRDAFASKNVTVLKNTVDRQRTVYLICKEGADEGLRLLSSDVERVTQEKLGKEAKVAIDNMRYLFASFRSLCIGKTSGSDIGRELSIQESLLNTALKKGSLEEADWRVFAESMKREQKVTQYFISDAITVEKRINVLTVALATSGVALMIAFPQIPLVIAGSLIARACYQGFTKVAIAFEAWNTKGALNV